MPLLARVTQLAAAIESTAGTAETLDATDAKFNAYNVTVTPNIPFLERQLAASFTPGKGAIGSYSGTVTFEVDMIGGTADPQWLSVLMPCCGWVDSGGTYSPKSEAPGSNVKCATIGWYENGRYKQLHGCAGTWEATWTSGENMRIRFTFTGLWSAPTDVAILTPTRETALPIRFASSGLTVGGAAIQPARTLTIRAGNVVALRGDSTTASGFKTAMVTGRRMTGTVNPEAVAVATKDWHGIMLASTEAALALTIGSAGNRITLAAPALQVTNVQYGDEEGRIVDVVEFQLNRSAGTGNDEFTIASD